MAARLRVLHLGKFYPPHRGGIETYLELLCRRLRKRVDVEVIVANDGAEDSSEILDGIRVRRLKNLMTLASSPICPGLIRAIRETEADIIHLHWPHPLAVAAYLASGQKAALVATYHSDVVRQKILGALLEPLLRRALNRCRTVIATSAKYVESSPVLSDYKDRCRIIPYGIPPEDFIRRDENRIAEIRARYGARIVLSVGRLVYYKGFEHLIDAMSRVNGRLLIIGEGPLRTALERRARRLGLAERITFLGKLDTPHIVPYYQASQVFALASTERSEAFGIVQLEAMACGLPVVNTRIPSGVPSVSLDGVTGLTVAPGDPRALSEAINQLLDNPTLAAAFGQAGRLRVQREFNLDIMASRTLEAYEQAIRR